MVIPAGDFDALEVWDLHWFLAIVVACVWKMTTELAAFVSAEAIDVTIFHGDQSVVLPTADGTSVFPFKIADQCWHITVFVDNADSQLAIIVSSGRVNLSLIFANEDGVVV